MPKRTDTHLYFRDLNDSQQRDLIHSWNCAGRLDLVHAVNNGIDISLGGFFLDDNDIEILD